VRGVQVIDLGHGSVLSADRTFEVASIGLVLVPCSAYLLVRPLSCRGRLRSTAGIGCCRCPCAFWGALRHATRAMSGRSGLEALGAERSTPPPPPPPRSGTSRGGGTLI